MNKATNYHQFFFLSKLRILYVMCMQSWLLVIRLAENDLHTSDDHTAILS